VIFAFGRISSAEAKRFDMLKKAATAAMSQMSPSESPRRAGLAIGLVHRGRIARHLDREIEHWRGGAAESSAAR